ncbi:uncharacterized protein LOC123974817 isoform X2 [Micropterus dolomieu]|uniref:uncharacterized protein LOC123974817 isoform X2 n=1 Tax=Micropterus dolomieu TaxID=147949 RepID=UPI001E8DA8B3|nr:uncharacterized protein LOC123974817 isoform X2 [Micropterus dolomieu]
MLSFHHFPGNSTNVTYWPQVKIPTRVVQFISKGKANIPSSKIFSSSQRVKERLPRATKKSLQQDEEEKLVATGEDVQNEDTNDKEDSHPATPSWLHRRCRGLPQANSGRSAPTTSTPPWKSCSC